MFGFLYYKEMDFWFIRANKQYAIDLIVTSIIYIAWYQRNEYETGVCLIIRTISTEKTSNTRVEQRRWKWVNEGRIDEEWVDKSEQNENELNSVKLNAKYCSLFVNINDYWRRAYVFVRNVFFVCMCVLLSPNVIFSCFRIEIEHFHKEESAIF